MESFFIAGAGLMGGSLIKALRKAYPQSIIRAGVRKPDQYPELKNWTDGVFALDQIPLIKEKTIAVINTPVYTIPDLAEILAGKLTQDSIITDVGSTKQGITEALKGIKNFIGSHPMAGKEKAGFEHSDPSIFIDKTAAICPYDFHQEEMILRLEKFWQSIGMKTIRIAPSEHDWVTAYSSHLPHALSFIFGALGKNEKMDLKGIYGNSFLEFSRIGKSEEEIWIPIFQSNKKNLVVLIEKFIKFLYRFQETLENNQPEEIKKLIEDSKEFLKTI
ncbi:MAG: hypothetical protein A2Y41_10930 [Spirochaetes bacterium GWB1_36_13]|nr:MAG: hypothetical protein A2Y41_10930 [Spirochaetes bacterium GWB1_36_13]